MLWGSIEGTATNNGDLSNGSYEDSWAAVGGSGNDQIVCQWRDDKVSKSV